MNEKKTKEQLIKEITEAEWQMFQNVQNQGGRASCQDDQKTFFIMRQSQFATWPQDALSGLQNDLEDAGGEGRNLISEKYARMMAGTHPEEYRRLEPLLPMLPPALRETVEKIVSIHMEWFQEYARRYPRLAARGRVFYSSQDTRERTSVETYLRGELLTYSQTTLCLYLDYLMTCRDSGINLVEQCDSYMVQAYGYSSLEEAEKH